MTQPESRTVEDIFAETIWDALSDREVLRIHADGPKELADITASILAAAKEHGLVIGEGELDAAWKEVEAALPEGWSFWQLTGDAKPGPVYARVRLANVIYSDGTVPEVSASGSTLARALRALAERLRR